MDMKNISNNTYCTYVFWGVFLRLDNDGGFRGKFSGFRSELEGGAVHMAMF